MWAVVEQHRHENIFIINSGRLAWKAQTVRDFTALNASNVRPAVRSVSKCKFSKLKIGGGPVLFDLYFV